MPLRAIDQFKANIGYVRSLLGLYRVLKTQVQPAVDLSDLLRGTMVQLVSSLDQYLHEKVRQQMLEVHRDPAMPKHDAFNRFPVTLGGAREGIRDPSSSDWLDSEIRVRHSYRTFQQPDDIADAIRLCSPIQLWPSIAASLGEDQTQIKLRLQLIVRRRNSIAHEADVDPANIGQRLPIQEADVDQSIDFVERLCNSIEALVT